MSVNHIEILNLKKSYGKQNALNDVSLTIEKGSMNFLLGANGSGKSTLLKCLAGHEYWNSGEILFNGQSRKVDRKDFNKGLHFISEDIVPPPASLGVLRSFYQNTFSSWNEEVFQKYVSWGNLDLSQNLSGVSRGQKIQGLLALSLAVDPDILIIDEATAVLDPFIRSRFVMEIAARQQNSEMTTIIATNIGSEISALKGRMLIMKMGKVLVDRPAESISEGLVKIRIEAMDLEKVYTLGFSFLEQNADMSISLLGKVETLENLQVTYQVDRRSITVEEIFIFYSDRSAK